MSVVGVGGVGVLLGTTGHTDLCERFRPASISIVGL